MSFKVQNAAEAVDVARWRADDEYSVYPEGARDKSRLSCPEGSSCRFLISNHQYLFKHSRDAFPEQYWVEILAYRLGEKIGVPVPPAFVAYDSDNGASGALIEWFYKSTGDVVERYIHGGDYMQRLIEGYDRKVGRQHNFESISAICKMLKQHAALADNWVIYWAKVLTFDALIGNTDRHHDNWGVIYQFLVGRDVDAESGEISIQSTRLAPTFDNGTSMGHEIPSEKFHAFSGVDRMKRYVARGTHHMKWKQGDGKRINHGDMLLNYCDKFSIAKESILDCLNISDGELSVVVSELTKFDVLVPLSEERADFMVNLLTYRKNYLFSLVSGHV